MQQRSVFVRVWLRRAQDESRSRGGGRDRSVTGGDDQLWNFEPRHLERTFASQSTHWNSRLLAILLTRLGVCVVCAALVAFYALTRAHGMCPAVKEVTAFCERIDEKIKLQVEEGSYKEDQHDKTLDRLEDQVTQRDVARPRPTPCCAVHSRKQQPVQLVPAASDG